MAIRNILVAFDGSDAAQAALRLGARMAAKYGAHLTGLMVHGGPPAYLAHLAERLGELREVLAEQDRAAMARSEATFRAMTADVPHAHWLTIEGRPDAVLAERARYADVVLIGRPPAGTDETAFSIHPDRLALQSGRPLIVAPAGYDSPLGDRAVVAWDGQRAAARALADAMLILETKDLVTILTVEREEGAMVGPVALLREHLDRHGVATDWARVSAGRRPVSAAIVDWCAENRPTLLVMGAYEHSKFREDLIGGVTNAVLDAATCPVLMAH